VDARKETCRQALVILQHDDFLFATSEFGFHERVHINFLTGRQLA